jgi:uncharacterized membrane protein YhiD involved in acid resistance
MNSLLAAGIFDGFEDLTGTFSVLDVTLALVLSFVLSVVIGFVYRATHKGVSYSQSFVQTLVLLGMIIAVIMLVVGSNIARAFSLVGSLSVIRFRNPVKETRDVAFLFMIMAIGMAVGTKFYSLAAIATVVISLAIVIMSRFNMFALTTTSQLLKVQVDSEPGSESLISDALTGLTTSAELVSADSVRSGDGTELLYNVVLRKGVKADQVVDAVRQLNGGQRVSLLTGYNTIDL